MADPAEIGTLRAALVDALDTLSAEDIRDMSGLTLERAEEIRALVASLDVQPARLPPPGPPRVMSPEQYVRELRTQAGGEVVRAVQPLVDLLLEHFEPYGSVDLDRSWGSRGQTLRDRLHLGLELARRAGVDVRGVVEFGGSPTVADCDWIPRRG